jgi:hypothetical protein
VPHDWRGRGGGGRSACRKTRNTTRDPLDFQQHSLTDIRHSIDLLLVGGFLALFALDAFPAGTPFLRALPDFLMHLVPALIIWGVVAVSWRWPLVGGLTFIALALGYLLVAWPHWSWALVISGPLVVVGTLFALSGRVPRLRAS